MALALLIGDEEAISYKQRLIPATVGNFSKPIRSLPDPSSLTRPLP